MSEASILDAHSLALGKITLKSSGKRANIVFSWLIFKIVDILRHRSVQHKSVIVTGIITNVLVLISVLSAFPWVRKLVFLLIY